MISIRSSHLSFWLCVLILLNGCDLTLEHNFRKQRYRQMLRVFSRKEASFTSTAMMSFAGEMLCQIPAERFGPACSSDALWTCRPACD
jgi:hypothetical protein